MSHQWMFKRGMEYETVLLQDFVRSTKHTKSTRGSTKSLPNRQWVYFHLGIFLKNSVFHRLSRSLSIMANLFVNSFIFKPNFLNNFWHKVTMLFLHSSLCLLNSALINSKVGTSSLSYISHIMFFISSVSASEKESTMLFLLLLLGRLSEGIRWCRLKRFITIT